MSSVSSIYSSSSRITGMYSDMDTDAMVESMCSTQQSKIDTQEQKKTTYNWYNEAVSEVLDAVEEFSNTYCSVLGTSSMLKSSTYSAYSVTSDSDSSAVTVTASGSAEIGTVSVKVLQLAENSSVSSSGKVSADGTEISSGNTATLAELSFANKLNFDSSGEISFSINGNAFTFSSDTTLQSMINTINTDTDANVTMKYSRLTDTFTITSDSGGEDSSLTIVNISGNAFGTDGAFQINTGKVSNGQNSISEINGITVERDSNEYEIDGISYELNAVTADSDDNTMKILKLAENASITSSGGVSSDGTEISADNTATLVELSLANELEFDENGEVSFSINGTTFTFSEDTTLQDMLDTINNDTGANVTMTYSRLKDRFTITADSGGEDSKVSIYNVSGNAFGTDGAFQIEEGVTQNGQNSIAVIEGVTVERNSNEYTIDGITYELTEVTEETNDETITFTIERDYSSTVEAVSEFVDALNTLLTTLDSLVNEKDYSTDYKPLTDAQKEEMSESEIEAWNKKAKSGVLRYDSNLESLISNIKNAFFTSAGGTGKASTTIGISTAGYFNSDSGLLVLDTDALTEALKANPDEVISMFTNGTSSSDSDDQGITYKIKNALSAYQEVADDSVSNTEDKIDDIEDEIETLEDKLEALAEKYYEKFSAMETALATLNSQSSYISQLFE